MLTLRYWLRLVGFFVLVLAVVLSSLPFLFGSLLMVGLLYVPCQRSDLRPTDYGYDWEEVTIKASAGGSFGGYFFPGSNGATIVLPPAGANDRNARLREAAVLLRHGYAVLTYESRRCADMGPLSLGYHEVSEVADALDYLQTRSDVDTGRIGILGFSTAGATAIMAAARLPALRAVVAKGGYGDFVKNALGTGTSGGPIGYFEVAYRWAAKGTYRLLTGLNIERLSPVSVIDEIAPRPILLIYGSREVSLPGGRQQHRAAGENAELWIVPGAVHGNYLDIAPEAYEQRVVSFFDEALTNPNRYD